MRRLGLLAAGALLAAAPGCIGVGFDLTDLPEAPLAIVYRTREESERRVELIQQAQETGLKRQSSETYDASFLRLEAAAEADGGKAGYWSRWTADYDYLYVLFTSPGYENPDPLRLIPVYAGDRFVLYQIRNGP